MSVISLYFSVSRSHIIARSRTGSFAEALAADGVCAHDVYSVVCAYVVGAQSDLLQKNNYWRLNASLCACGDTHARMQHCLIAGSS